jgi:predicted permease
MKMAILPLLTFIILHLMGKSGLPYRMALMESAMPPGLNVSVKSCLQFRQKHHFPQFFL